MRTQRVVAFAAMMTLSAAAAGQIDGTVLGNYAGAMVCGNAECVDSDAGGNFSLDDTGILVARVWPYAERVGGGDPVTVERALLFAAPPESPQWISARSTMVVAEMLTTGADYGEALATVADQIGVMAEDLLLPLDQVTDELTRQRLLQAENEGAERLRIELALEPDLMVDSIPLADYLKRDPDARPLETCGRTYFDAATAQYHDVGTSVDDSNRRYHLTFQVEGDDLPYEFVLLSMYEVRCAQDYVSVEGAARGGNAWASETVCLDATNDGSCADEASRYTAQIDDQGRFELPNLPVELLRDYDLIAQAQDGRMLRAPGWLAQMHSSSQVVLTPAVSIIAEYARQNDGAFEFLYPIVLIYWGLDPVIDLSAIDYFGFDALTSAQALAVFNDRLIDDPNYTSLMNGGRFDEDYFDQVQEDVTAALGQPLYQAVDAEELRYWFGNDAWLDDSFDGSGAGHAAVDTSSSSLASASLKQRMSDAIASASNLSAAPEVMIRAEDGLNALFAEALGRNPSLHDPSEYEERSDPGALSNAIREIAIDATGEIPYVGIFVSGLLDLVWPKQEADVQALLKMLYEDAQSIISQRLRIHTEKKYLLKLATIRLALNEYRKGENLDLKAQAFERAFERTRSIVDEMLLQDPEYRSYIAPLTMLAVNTEMTLQKERYLNYEALESVLPIISREACLEDWVRRYDFIRDAVLVGGIDQFPKSLYREYLDGREQKRESRAWGNPDTWMLIWKTGECHGEVKDLETGYEYHGELAATFTENGCFNNPTIFAPTVDNIRARLTLETELNAARTLASVMLMARVLPEGALEAQADRDAADPDRKEEDRVHVRDATELLGKNAYFAPKDMREFDIGPYARPCYVHDGSNRDNYCELGQLTKWEARFDAPIRSIKIGFNDPAIRQIWLEDVNGNAKAAGLETVAHSKQPNPSPPAGQRLIGLGAAQLPLGGSPLQQVVWSIEPIFSRLGPDDQDPKRDNLYFFKSQRLCANERSDDCPLGPTHGDGVLRSPITPTLNGSYDFPVIGVSVYPHSPGALRVRFGFSPNGNQIVRPQ